MGRGAGQRYKVRVCGEHRGQSRRRRPGRAGARAWRRQCAAAAAARPPARPNAASPPTRRHASRRLRVGQLHTWQCSARPLSARRRVPALPGGPRGPRGRQARPAASSGRAWPARSAPPRSTAVRRPAARCSVRATAATCAASSLHRPPRQLCLSSPSLVPRTLCVAHSLPDRRGPAQGRAGLREPKQRGGMSAAASARTAPVGARGCSSAPRGHEQQRQRPRGRCARAVAARRQRRQHRQQEAQRLAAAGRGNRLHVAPCQRRPPRPAAAAPAPHTPARCTASARSRSCDTAARTWPGWASARQSPRPPCSAGSALATLQRRPARRRAPRRRRAATGRAPCPARAR